MIKTILFMILIFLVSCQKPSSDNSKKGSISGSFLCGIADDYPHKYTFSDDFVEIDGSKEALSYPKKDSVQFKGVTYLIEKKSDGSLHLKYGGSGEEPLACGPYPGDKEYEAIKAKIEETAKGQQ